MNTNKFLNRAGVHASSIYTCLHKHFEESMVTCEQIKAKCQTLSMNISADVLALISMVNSDLMLLFNDYRCRNVLTGNCPNLRRLHIWQLLLNSITTKYLNLQPDRFFNPHSPPPSVRYANRNNPHRQQYKTTPPIANKAPATTTTPVTPRATAACTVKKTTTPMTPLTNSFFLFIDVNSDHYCNTQQLLLISKS